MTDGNGHQADNQPAEQRIPFGDKPTQTLPAAWAEGMLRELYRAHRPMFGRILQTYVTGQEVGTPGPKAGN